jgi:MFS family permease
MIEIWHLVVLGFGQGATWAFIVPSRQALIPELVGEDELMNALALNNGAINVTRIVGPAAAGGLIAIPMFGVSGVFYTMVLLYGIVLLTLLRVPKTGKTRGERGPVWREMTVGLRYVTGRPVLVVLIGIAFVAVLLGMPYSTLLPVFAEDVHDVGSVGLGIMSAFVGVGAVVGSLTMAYLSDYPHRVTLQLIVGVGFGLGLFMFAGAPVFALALAALSFMGFMATSYMTINNTLIFSNAEHQFHGRVMSVYMLTWSLMPLTALPMSMLTDVVGAQATVAGAGALVALLIGSIGLLYPGYRAIGRPTAVAADAPQIKRVEGQAHGSVAGSTSRPASGRS